MLNSVEFKHGSTAHESLTRYRRGLTREAQRVPDVLVRHGPLYKCVCVKVCEVKLQPHMQWKGDTPGKTLKLDLSFTPLTCIHVALKALQTSGWVQGCFDV